VDYPDSGQHGGGSFGLGAEAARYVKSCLRRDTCMATNCADVLLMTSIRLHTEHPDKEEGDEPQAQER
jgi:hypothetical protein